jgi:hypothetical protein
MPSGDQQSVYMQAYSPDRRVTRHIGDGRRADAVEQVLVE